jgi:hypothetical protein
MPNGLSPLRVGSASRAEYKNFNKISITKVLDSSNNSDLDLELNIEMEWVNVLMIDLE